MSNSNPWLLLLAGFLLGFVVEWLIELWYWRRQRMASQQQTELLRNKVHAQAAELSAANAHLEALRAAAVDPPTVAPSPPAPPPVPEPVAPTDLPPSETAPSDVSDSELTSPQAPAFAAAPAEPEFEAPQPPLPGFGAGLPDVPDTASTETSPPVSPAPSDDLTCIKGIGARFAQVLQEAGTTRFVELARHTPAELQAIVQAPAWRKVNYDDWIIQAQALVDSPPPVATGDDLTLIDGVGPAFASRLQEAGIKDFAMLASADAETLADIIRAPEWRRPDFADWIAQAQARLSS
ncbi:MAG: hypothetical protein GXP37_10830 [Chloroflexi bacterium]|nr:hypothetical protein [Chloroflexota bacterium]